MTGIELAILAFALMLLAIFLRLPIGLAMGLTGFFGIWYMMGHPKVTLSQLKTLSYDTFSSYSLSIVPLFLLMGQFATKSGMSGALFNAASDWLGHRKGGVAMAAVGACAGFGAVCGSSLATASTMGQVALPEMRKRGYSDALSTGVLAAGGTLGILIPPSVILVIYAILTEQNIVKMFIAALVPGILAALGYMLTVAVMVRINPDSATTAERVPYAHRFKTLLSIWPVVLIFGLVMGGIAGDWNWTKSGVQALLTPTEGAAVGAVATGLYGVMTGGLTWKGFLQSVLATAQSTAMIFFIVLGAQIFNSFLAFTQAPQQLAEWVAGQGYAPLLVLAMMLVAYLIFGCVMDSLSMILLTIPIFYPIIEVLDFGLTPEEAGIWFGILALIVVEVGLITPPVGMNLFIINSMARDIPMAQTYRGVAPFVLSDLIRVVVLVAFPGITLWLVGVLF
ncbi:C4-dicarboxylate TRAP transporter large permease protein DctM [Aliiroseovarius sp. xm-m-379]|uniref:TRAP transporter large permease n=1 Tax=unclassified Aliiroseovarius TaxID=2623558 RepID=UPI001568EC16|nr:MULTISPECIES: TRAP transporter large permease [unclassified Aliiroseovarius]NRP26132.1 C4-dicarboxylate TRAP transporter large permease protein DctM [Aliiroseovarius sp. xm-m-379]NRP34931.1 C4-dicarboxylate TRAP transporter large permease protein DctM [Aliiroseovarius sp. xm-a-104]NRP51197.1 C4-dicarboxylate TRAP transporter large permease protein DctM [Aliiroseovarius sp. xm-m-354]NRQ05949.1 C4-dicarboxylate TRAP transporter large permease protein DctM [Aliiroseovarius sp. xm-m-309]NRQ0915